MKMIDEINEMMKPMIQEGIETLVKHTELKSERRTNLRLMDWIAGFDRPKDEGVLKEITDHLDAVSKDLQKRIDQIEFDNPDIFR